MYIERWYSLYIYFTTGGFGYVCKYYALLLINIIISIIADVCLVAGDPADIFFRYALIVCNCGELDVEDFLTRWLIWELLSAIEAVFVQFCISECDLFGRGTYLGNHVLSWKVFSSERRPMGWRDLCRGVHSPSNSIMHSACSPYFSHNSKISPYFV